MIRTACMVAFALACLAAPAWADDCAPLAQVNALNLVAGPNRALVPVSINGVPKLFLLDTGGGVSMINGNVADELGLAQRDSNLKMLDLYGNASEKYVSVGKFGVGRQIGEDIHLAVSPDPNFGQGTRFVGLFSPDLMGRYDIEIDFGTYKMNYFSKDHCPGKVVYWPHQALAVLPFTFQKNHLKISVKVDGKDLTAIIDTGASNTSMKAEAAKRIFDISPDSQGNIAMNARGMAGAFERVFSTLDFEGVAVTNPHIVVIPQLVGRKDRNNGFRTDTRVKMVDDIDDAPDMLIGMDILKKLHLYIAFGENRIFISEASTPSRPSEPPTSAAVASTTSQQ
ncbi:MAG TPA: aspartyl protease family protein [Rhizomicrobium sp.]|nr:aspartyl protease family protein [Rhizomicrobium sp.]